jgi:trans-2,3-dihydro-3-hydroxyanthranilate isomerase
VSATHCRAAPAERPHRMIRVFAMPGSRAGGNPAPVWLDADGLSTAMMQQLARASGHESVFVLNPSDGSSRFQMRYFVPAHEMEMCGHATIAALWLLHQRRAWDGTPTTVQTASGSVGGRIIDGTVEISQPRATVIPLGESLVRDIAQCLRVESSQIVAPVLNAATSRVKTLIRLTSVETLHALQLDIAGVPALCDQLGSTGLYPFALLRSGAAGLSVSARQFPKSSSYPEDPATGIAASALAWGLRELKLASDERSLLTVHQGEAMASPSSIFVRLPATADPEQICWLRGDAQEMEDGDERH